MPVVLPPGLVRLSGPLPPGVHPEAGLLVRCAAAGLAVPDGAVLLSGSQDLGPLDPAEHVTLRLLGAPAGVRVAAGDAQAALRSLRPADGDVLVLRAVASVHAGDLATATTHDVVRAVEGEAHELHPGARVLAVPRLGSRLARAHRGADAHRTPLPPWAMRLSRLAREVRRVAPGLTGLTWADDGRTCRLLGVRS